MHFDNSYCSFGHLPNLVSSSNSRREHFHPQRQIQHTITKRDNQLCGRRHLFKRNSEKWHLELYRPTTQWFPTPWKIRRLTENSDIIIFSHLSYDYLRKISVLTYFAEGQGTQTLNIGIGAGKEQGGINIEWSVIENDTFIAQGNKWNITPEGTLTMTGFAGNVTVFYFSLGENASGENLSFIQQHSIVILTAFVVVVTIVVAIVVRAKSKKHSD
jgi:hypothetical protein